MNSRLVFVTGLLLAALVGSPRAEIRCDLQGEVTMPDSVGVSGTIQIADFTGDGYAELVVADASPIVAYSLSENRVVDFFLRASDGLIRSYAAAYVDGDDRLDIAEAVLIPGDSSDTFALVCRYGADSYATPDTVYAVAGLDTSRTYAIDKLFFADVDSDGLKELFAQYSYYTLSYINLGYEPIKVYHYAYAQYSFQQSAASTPTSIPPYGYSIYVSSDSTQPVVRILSSTSSYYEPMSHGRGSTSRTYYNLHLQLRSGAFVSKTFGSAVSCSVSPFDSHNDYSSGSALVAAAAGDIFPNMPGLEMVTFSNNYYGVSGFYGSCSKGGSQLRLVNLNDSSNWVTVTSVLPYTGAIAGLFFDSRFEDRFLSIGGGLIRLHDALTFEVVDQTASALSGEWVGYVTLQAGEPPVAVLHDGRTFRFYTLSLEPTGVDDNPHLVLPTTFTLGEPYPNPFNPTVTIPLAVDQRGHLRVEVFNPLGQRVTVLHDAVASAGETTLNWDASSFGSGVYLVKATLGDKTRTVKAVLVK